MLEKVYVIHAFFTSTIVETAETLMKNETPDFRIVNLSILPDRGNSETFL